MAPARDTFVLPGTYVDPTCPVNWEHPLTAGLVAMWRTVATPGWSGGITVRDLVRGGGHAPHDGTISGTVGSAIKWQGPRGRRGGEGSLLFDGSFGGVLLSSQLRPAGPGITIHAWAQFTSLPGIIHILTWDNAAASRVWQYRVNASSNLQFVPFNQTGANGSVVGATSLSTGVWYFLTGTWDGTTCNAYVNGVLDGTSSFSGTSLGVNGNATAPWLGRSDLSPPGIWVGPIDEAVIYNRALSSDEVSTFYQSSKAGHPELLNYLGVREYSFAAATTSFTLSAGVGTFTLTGDAAGLKSARKLASGKGTFALTGDAAGLKAGHKVAAGKGTFTLTGDAAGLKSARKLAAGKGTFTLTGDAATLKVARKTAAGVGVFIVSGKVAILTGPGNKILAAAAGTFTLTGQTAGLKAGRRAVAAAGAFALTGRPATLTGPAPPPTPTITGGASGGGIALQWMERELKKQQRKSQVIDVRGKPARLTVQVHSPAVETLPRRPIPYLYSPVVTAMSRVNVRPIVIRWWEQVQQERRFEGMLTAHLKRQAEEIWLMTRD